MVEGKGEVMAVVRTDTYHYKEGEFKRQVRVLNDGLFRIKLPSWTQTVLSYEEVFADTQREAIRKYDQALREYEQAQTQEKKVILYEIKYNAYIWGDARHRKDLKDVDPDKQVCILNEQKISFSQGMGLTVAAGVYIERKIEIAGTDRFTFKYDSVKGDDALPYSTQQRDSLKPTWGKEATNKIDWTPERHQFFIMLHDAMSRLIWRIHHFEDQNKLVEFIDSGRKLLE